MPTPNVLFVCTGNICRSPMAEYLMRGRLGRRARWRVSSAGLAAADGLPASDAAIRTLHELGYDLRPHRSRPLTRALVDAATLIVVMTRAHRDQIQMLFPSARDRLYLLKTFDPRATDSDVDDPIGLSMQAYAKACAEIESALPGLIEYLKTFERPDEPS